jgi:N-acetylglucosaminyldiphosphoundecaprenol N-acetyl-beta-D-mannosaminyltransferase
MFGFQYSKLDANEIVDEITRPREAGAQGAKIIVTANSDHIGRLTTDEVFRKAYLYASIRTADGFLVHYYALLRGERIPRVTGCEILAALMRNRDLTSQRLFFVADSDATTAGLRKWAAGRNFPASNFEIVVPPYQFELDQTYTEALVARIREFAPSILVLGVGAPKSEKFAYVHRNLLPACWVLSVGEAVKIEAGVKQRAPLIMQRLNLEWFWRLAHEPRRLFRRYTWDMRRFFFAIIQDIRGAYDNPEPPIP